ncbi:MAG: hypothetical protein ABL999_00730 [Pyrinomonadaceae bacterium]
MKRCPKCFRTYADETQNFCLDDGAWLTDPGLAPEHPTAVIPSRVLYPSEPKTQILTHAPDAMTVSMSGYQPNSIAVLPFAHLSSDPDDEYFCDGLAEELINALSRVDDLKVVARTSAFSFKGKNVDIATVGATLGVNNVVEGSVRKSGERMRISVQMINTSDGFTVWSDKYDTKLHDIFDVQDEITSSVVNALKSKLLNRTDEDVQLSALLDELRHHAHDVEAYQLYLRGRFLFNKFNEQDLYRALDCFRKAIEADADFAEAYSGVADVYMWLTELGPIAPREGMPKAKEAALKAILLNPELSEAHTSLGIVLQEFDYDFHAAETEYKLAIELNPNNALAHQLYGALLAQLGRFSEGERRFRNSLRLDPLSPMGSWIYPFGLFLERRFDESIDRARKILELDGRFAAAYLILSFAYQMKGDVEACKENYCSFLEIFGLTDAAAEARVGFDRDGWMGFLETMTAPHVRSSVTSYISAVYFAALGDNDAAIQCLEESLDKREGHMVMLNVDPRFDEIRPDPRFRKIIETIGFPSLQS